MRRFGSVALSGLTLFASVSLMLWGLTKPAVAMDNPCDPNGTVIAKVICPPPSTGYIYVCLEHPFIPRVYPQCFLPS